MGRFLPSPRRLLALTGAAALGIAGSVVFASPASATHAELTSRFDCVSATTGKITWTLKNAEWGVPGTLKDVSTPVGGITNGAILAAVKDKQPTTLTGTQTVDLSQKKVQLKLTVVWGNGHTSKNDVWVDFSKEKCGKPEGGKPEVVFTPNCDGTGTAKLMNRSDVQLTFLLEGQGWKRSDGVGAKGQVTIDVPANVGEVKVKVDGGGDLGKFTWEAPKKPCDKPTITSVSNCTELRITVNNPVTNGTISLSAKSGDTEQKEELAGGKSFTFIFPGSTHQVVKVAAGDERSEVKFTQTGDCNTLPVTGANSGLIAGGALVLLAGGAGLFYMFRRRRIQFTA